MEENNQIVTIAFKKSFYDWHFDSMPAFFIWFFSGFGKHCHTELMFPNGWSCSAEPGPGIRMKRIRYSHPERWDFLHWNVTDPRFGKQYKNVKELHNLCLDLQGTPYDWPGIIGQAIGNPGFNETEYYFCSEFVAWLMGFKRYHLDPSILYRKTKEIIG